MKTAAMPPPGLLQVYRINRIWNNCYVFGERMAKQDGSPLEVITRRDEKHGVDAAAYDYISPED